MIVIIGGGISGVTCAEQLAELCPQEQITLISVSKLVKACTNVRQVSRVITDFDVEEKPSAYLESIYSNVKVHFGAAENLNCQKHELYLESGKVYTYKKLCICTGGRPKLFAPDNPYIIGIRDVETISVFQERLHKAKRIIIVGNGGIATELVYELENCEIIWAIKDSSIGATFFDAGAAQFLLPHLSIAKDEPTQCYSQRIKYTFDKATSEKPQSYLGSALGPDWALGAQLKEGRKRCSR